MIFGMARQIDALQSDIKNLEKVEEALKTEIDELVLKRKELEDANQLLKNQV